MESVTTVVYESLLTRGSVVVKGVGKLAENKSGQGRNAVLWSGVPEGK